MLSTIAESYPFVFYAAPPLIGALIGYLTNRVAIRMLFRPLRAWHLGPLKIPMTPGVIPSKRHELAVNIGDMVGEHLVTGDEVSRALQKERFQEHLRLLIETAAGSLMKKDLGSLASIIPNGYRVYFNIGVKTVSYRIKEIIRTSISSEHAERLLIDSVEAGIERFMNRPVEEVFPRKEQAAIIDRLAGSVHESIASGRFEKHLESLIEAEIESALRARKSCKDILPEALIGALSEIVRNQTEFLLGQAAAMTRDPDVRDRIVSAAQKGVDEFIDTLGPMSSMVRGFVDADMVEEKIRWYLDEKQDEIDSLFHDELIVIRVRAALGERIGVLLETPLAHFSAGMSPETVPMLSRTLATGIVALFGRPGANDIVADLIGTLFSGGGETGTRTIGTACERLFGHDGAQASRQAIRAAALQTMRSSEFLRLLDRAVDEIGEHYLNTPIGRLDRLVPPGVVDGACRSLREMATRGLIAEIPTVVSLMQISRMVSDKVDSFDLLRLERLLLSIMEEQFRYINLFGALLGCIIGCVNLLFMLGG